MAFNHGGSLNSVNLFSKMALLEFNYNNYYCYYYLLSHSRKLLPKKREILHVFKISNDAAVLWLQLMAHANLQFCFT